MIEQFITDFAKGFIIGCYIGLADVVIAGIIFFIDDLRKKKRGK